ncbi:hypothetical protein HBN54_004553 [Hymenobacter sp. 1B]|uniref:Secreted protein n=1 Tax=Hymenobacter artigasi TaxID=2719616 RepID=A0ABX1HPW9_9BACT|nr:hypothetical protein [Hymenobacter artigasi]
MGGNHELLKGYEFILLALLQGVPCCWTCHCGGSTRHGRIRALRNADNSILDYRPATIISTADEFVRC